MFLYSNDTVLSRKILNLFITTVSSTVTVMVVVIKKILLNIYLLMYVRTGDTIQEIFNRFLKNVRKLYVGTILSYYFMQIFGIGRTYVYKKGLSKSCPLTNKQTNLRYVRPQIIKSMYIRKNYNDNNYGGEMLCLCIHT